MLNGYDAHPAGAPESARWSARVRLNAEGKAVAALPGAPLVVARPVDFHPAPSEPSALDALLAALGGEILSAFARAARRAGLTLDAAEVALSCHLENPLVAAGVIGESGSPALARVTLTLYVATPDDETVARAALETALVSAPVYHTLRRACPVEIHLKVTY